MLMEGKLTYQDTRNHFRAGLPLTSEFILVTVVNHTSGTKANLPSQYPSLQPALLSLLTPVPLVGLFTGQYLCGTRVATRMKHLSILSLIQVAPARHKGDMFYQLRLLRVTSPLEKASNP